MSRYILAAALLITATSLISFGTAQWGPETKTVTLDDIIRDVASSVDLGNPNIEQTAVTIAKDYPGEYNINQVCEVFNTLRKGWFYFSDPSYMDKYKNAYRTLQDGKIGGTIGMGDCDDYAILMASLIASLGGSPRIIFASNGTNPEGHAYCEVFLGWENDSQVEELLNWTKAEYNLTKAPPGLNRTREGGIWLNLDWWAKNPGGPYFEGERKDVVWDGTKSRNSPVIVPIIDTMDDIAGWVKSGDDRGSNTSISAYPARKNLGVNISYNLKEGGWVGIYKNITPHVLSEIEGLNFSCYAVDDQSTIELRLVHADGREFGYSWKPDQGRWMSMQALFGEFKCVNLDKSCAPLDNRFDCNSIERIEFIISIQPGNKDGTGRIILDHIRGVMNIPQGSPWARAEEQRKRFSAKDLALKSEQIRIDDPSKLTESVKLAVESLDQIETFEGQDALRQGLALLPHPIATVKHDAGVCKVACSPDGKRIATASYDNTTRIWDSSTGKELAKMVNNDSVYAVAFSPDGTRIATGSLDKTVRIWEASTGKEMARIMHDDGVLSIAFSPDGTKIASASRDMTARIWDILLGKVIILQHQGKVVDLAFSSDGTKLATGSLDKTARIWDVQTGQELLNQSHDGEVISIAFSPEGERLVTASGKKGNIARIWNTRTGEMIASMENVGLGQTEIYDVAFSPDGTKIGTASWDSTARIWDAFTGCELVRMKHDQALWAVAFSPDGSKLATSSRDKTARIWDCNTGAELVRLAHSDQVFAILFSPDGTKIITGSQDKSARIWDSLRGKEQTIVENGDTVRFVAFSPDNTRISTISFFSNAKTCRIWDSFTGKELARMDHEGMILSGNFSPEGARFATASADNTARVWDAFAGDELANMSHNNTVYCVAFSPNGSRIATASYDHTARVWNASSGKELAKVEHGNWVQKVTFSPDETMIATSSIDNTVRVWDALSGKPLGNIECLANEVVFSPDSTKIVVSDGEKIRIFDKFLQEELDGIANVGRVNSIVFSPDGTKIASAS